MAIESSIWLFIRNFNLGNSITKLLWISAWGIVICQNKTKSQILMTTVKPVEGNLQD